ncbi:MAG TPA: isocitrate/isopropylmalate dehydrogenase family protein [Pirellulaceae bacterium]|jgi:3-isopropylmalate dehydrogenase
MEDTESVAEAVSVRSATLPAPPAPSLLPRTFDIAVLPGDGIGPEVMAEALRVLNAVIDGTPAVRLAFQELPAGAGEFLRGGDPLPAATLDACRQADAILMGAMGLPDIRWPDGREIAPQIDLREQLDLYCGLRPIHLYHAVDTPLKRYEAGDIDLLIVRENTEGLFSSRGRQPSADASEVHDVMRISRAGSQRLFRAAFEEARRRRRKVTLVDKANVLPSMVFFRALFDEVAQDFPDVQTERLYVDAAALYLIQRPETFDVIVTENMFGDILSDLAAALVGGMGLAPSADIGDQSAVFQPAHGTAPDIAGRSIANPVAMILSAAIMLNWLGDPQTIAAAARIRRAVSRVLTNSTSRTAELGGHLSTRAMGDAILAAL